MPFMQESEILNNMRVTGSGERCQVVLVSLSIQDSVLCARDGQLQAVPRNANEVAADSLQYQLSASVVHRQPRCDVIGRTGSSATCVATGIGGLDVVDEQRTSFT